MTKKTNPICSLTFTLIAFAMLSPLFAHASNKEADPELNQEIRLKSLYTVGDCTMRLMSNSKSFKKLQVYYSGFEIKPKSERLVKRCGTRFEAYIPEGKRLVIPKARIAIALIDFNEDEGMELVFINDRQTGKVSKKVIGSSWHEIELSLEDPLVSTCSSDSRSNKVYVRSSILLSPISFESPYNANANVKRLELKDISLQDC